MLSDGVAIQQIKVNLKTSTTLPAVTLDRYNPFLIQSDRRHLLSHANPIRNLQLNSSAVKILMKHKRPGVNCIRKPPPPTIEVTPSFLIPEIDLTL